MALKPDLAGHKMDEALGDNGWAGGLIRRFRRRDRSPWLDRDQTGIDRRILLAAILVFVGYFVGAHIGVALTFEPHPVSVLWPPNSILLAALLLTPRRSWWLILLAAFPAHCLVELQSNVPPAMVLSWFVSNCAEALIGASAVRCFVDGPLYLDSLSNVAVLCIGGVFLGPFLSSFLDAAFVAWNRWGGDRYWEVWRIRFNSNALAALTITPLILAWAQTKAPRRRIAGAALFEAVALLVALLTLGFVIFCRLSPDADLALLYAPLPLLLWAAIRFGPRGATTAITSVAFLAVWGATHGHGPFAENAAKESAFYVQIFLSFIALPLLFLAALMEERNRTQEILLEREERLSLVAETAHLALWAVDFECDTFWMNAVGRELFGLEPTERMSHAAFLARVHPEDRERVYLAAESARKAAQTFELEYRLRRKDGDIRWLISRGRYLRNNDGVLSELLGVAWDVTDQVAAGLELRSRQQELARLSRVAVMGELTASLAHELNQPLTAIASNAAAGKRFLANAGTIDPAFFGELLNDVFTDARRAGAVIHGIRQFIRKGDETRIPLDLNGTINEVLRLLHSDLLGRAARVETQRKVDLPTIQADPVQMQQVLMNLIVNSLEAMQELPAEQRRIIITTESSNGTIQVAVRDFGVGLPPRNPEKIFAHFFSTKPNGMGMGLAIVRSIVESHGGELKAENLPDGARLSFSLPVEKG